MPSSEPPTFANRIAKKKLKFYLGNLVLRSFNRKKVLQWKFTMTVYYMFFTCVYIVSVSLHLFGGSHTSDIVSFVSHLPCVNVLTDWNTLMPYKWLNRNARSNSSPEDQLISFDFSNSMIVMVSIKTHSTQNYYIKQCVLYSNLE